MWLRISGPRSGCVQISDRAKRLIEALHEPSSNEDRWRVAQTFLDAEGAEAIQGFVWRENKPIGPDLTTVGPPLTEAKARAVFVPLSEKIAQDRGHDEFP